jgi:putative endonuclease
MNNRIYPRRAIEKEIDEYKKKFIEKTKTYYVYIIRCGDKTYYTGYTTNLVRRFLQHQKGKGAKYTKGRAPFDIVYAEEYPTKSGAMKREYQIKQMTRKQKMELINA